MNQVGVPARTANGRAHREQHEWSPPRTAAERGRDALGAAEAAVRARPDDGDLDAARPHTFDEVGDEAPGEVALVPRVGRGEDHDSPYAHARRLLRGKQGGAANGPALPQPQLLSPYGT